MTAKEKKSGSEAMVLWLVDQLERKRQNLADLLHPDMPQERFMASCRLAFNANPDLADGTKTDLHTVLMSVMRAARSGLDVHGHYGHLVCYNNTKAGLKACSFLPDYKGVIAVMKASGACQDIEAELVYSADEFDVIAGEERRIHHKPFIRRKAADSRGEIIAAYTRVLLPSGKWVIKGLLMLEDIERIEAGIKAKNGPWGGPHRPEMVRKSSVHAAKKYLGIQTSDRAAAERLRAVDEAEPDESFDVDFSVAPPPSATERAKAALKARNDREEIETTIERGREAVPVGDPTPEEQAAILAREVGQEG